MTLESCVWVSASLALKRLGAALRRQRSLDNQRWLAQKSVYGWLNVTRRSLALKRLGAALRRQRSPDNLCQISVKLGARSQKGPGPASAD